MYTYPITSCSARCFQESFTVKMIFYELKSPLYSGKKNASLALIFKQNIYLKEKKYSSQIYV